MVQTKAKKETTKTAKLEAPVFALDGKSAKTEALPKEIFGQDMNSKLLAQYVRVYQANQRQGNASAKTRADVTGSMQKIYRQKGTGRARHSTAKANLFRGGGATFGPLVRDFSLSMNKKQKKQALFVSLSQKAKEGTIKVLDAESMTKEPKTKTVASALKAMKVTGKVLLVMPKVEKNALVLSTRNIKNADISQATTVNAYEVINHNEVIFVDNAITVLTNHFLKNENN
ncbi:50S ribosomal protein L4 [Candidatus Roizmanbacteria bacterium]|nr:MAG: 50S ribosomal protein L4 [Candidatus Roizmanbacteria bacterium]